MKKYLLNNKISRWFFKRYFGIEKEVFRLTKTSIHYWVNKEKGEAQCREYGQSIWNIPIIKKIKYAGIIALLFLKNPIGFLFLGATDNTATNNGDVSNYEAAPNTNYGGVDYNDHRGEANAGVREYLMQRWTLPSLSGTITKIESFLYYSSDSGLTGKTCQVHELTRDFTEAGMTWNKYDGTNNWTTPGGDYSATIIDTVAFPAAGNWMSLVLQGAGSDNPLNLNWGDSVRLFYRTAAADSGYGGSRSKEWTTPGERPYILITYTPAGPAKLKTWNGLDVAKIKTINSLEIAKVKTVNGLP